MRNFYTLLHSLIWNTNICHTEIAFWNMIVKTFEMIFSFMVVKYENIILLMETLINGTCYKVSTDVLYRLGCLRHSNLPVHMSDPSKCPSDVKEESSRARPCKNGMGHSCSQERYGSQFLMESKPHQLAETELFGLRTWFCLRDSDLVGSITWKRLKRKYSM